MRALRSALSLGVLLSLAAGASAQAPRFAGAFALPGVLCDCDPTDFVFRTTRPVPGHAAPDAASPVVRTVDAGRLIEANDWSEAWTVVLTPAVATALRDTTLQNVHRYGAVRSVDTFDSGAETAALPIRTGERVEYLTSVEGYAFFRYDGVVYGGDYPFYASAFARDREWGEQAVWFHLTPKPGRPAAWVRIVMDREDPARNVEMLCETHGGCVPAFDR
jgi:hypothetical protein